MLDSLPNKVEERLPVKFAKFLRAPILKNISEHLEEHLLLKY